MFRNDKITDDGGTGNKSPKLLESYSRCAHEYEHGLSGDLENSTDPHVQSVINEAKVRAIDDARYGRKR